MSEDVQEHVTGEKASGGSGAVPEGEIEDELSPIDAMQILSRTGRQRVDGPAKEGEASTGATAVSEAIPERAPTAESRPESRPILEQTVAVTEPPAGETKKEAAVEKAEPDETEEFNRMLEQYLGKIHEFYSGEIVDALIVDVKRTYVLVDVGDKAEGIIDIDEFVDAQGEIHVAVGDTIPVQILDRESETGQIHVSYRSAVSELAWQRVREAVRRGTPVSGRIAEPVRSGLIVDIGVPAFMPASQIDTARVENLAEWVGREVEAYVIDLDRQRRRVVLSRRKLIQEDEQRKRRRILDSLEPGQERVVRVKRILDFGAFADLGGLDGLIPREEVSWERGSDPNDYLKEGRDLKVRVVSVDRESGRVTLSRKQARPDPWEKVEEKYPAGSTIKGKVVGLADFGAFVSLEEGVRGMIHTSELSWANGPKRVQDFLQVGDTVRVVVLDIDKERRRMALGLKQVTKDPWLEVEGKFPPQTVVKGTVTAVTQYGAFVRLTEDFEGLIHVSDMTWEKRPKTPSHYVQVSQEVEAVVLRLDRERRRISLGFKQMARSPFERFVEAHPTGSEVHGKVTRVTSFGAFVEVAPEVEGLVHISQLDAQRVEKPEEAVQVGQIIEAKVMKIERKTQKISLSRKAYLKEQESREVAAYVSQSVSGGLKMGEILRGLKIHPVNGEVGPATDGQ